MIGTLLEVRTLETVCPEEQRQSGSGHEQKGTMDPSPNPELPSNASSGRMREHLDPRGDS